MSSKPKQTEQQKELERISIERERQLRVENARQVTKTFSDNIAFRKKLRGIFSLLSGGFQGFPALGVSGPRNTGSGGGVGSGGGSASPLGGSGTTGRSGGSGSNNNPRRIPGRRG